MSSLGKLVTRLGLIALFSAMPLAAQMGNGMKFTAPFPFHVGKTLMPSGTYLLTQPDDDNLAIAVVKSMDGLHTAAIVINPTESLEAPSQSKVIFEKYGDTLYFHRALIGGETYGIAAIPTKAERKAEEMASVTEERSLVAVGQ
ncbi:MAG: hypothetical protein ABSC65_05880 [Acidobacteriaceae bacterium]|jgi:hypothetical protein